MDTNSNDMLDIISRSHTTSTIRKINENKLNERFDDLPVEVLRNLVRRKLPEPDRKREIIVAKTKPVITKVLSNIVTSLALLDEPSMRKRLELFIGYCNYKQYTFNTTKQYLKILKLNNFFGNYIADDEKCVNNNNNIDSIDDDDHDNNVNSKNIDIYNNDSCYDGMLLKLLRPDKLAFAHRGNHHIRVVSMNDFNTFVKYLYDNFSTYTAPILIAAFTGLRSFEILQFSTYTLYQLLNHHQPIAIRRKQTVIKSYDIEPIFWSPIYNTHLNTFVENLRDLYLDDYNIFLQMQLNVKLFYITPKTLGNRVKSLFYNATGRMAPNGFGIHSCRNMLAMLMAQKSENIFAIQQFLQHKNTKTTRTYIKADFTHTTNEFNRLTNYEFSDINKKLIKINTDDDNDNETSTNTKELSSKKTHIN